MLRRATPLRAWDRAGLTVLCVLLALSVSMRVHAYGRGAEPEIGEAASVDLGDGVILARAEAVPDAPKRVPRPRKPKPKPKPEA